MKQKPPRRLTRYDATVAMKKALRKSGVDVYGIRTATGKWKGMEWMILICWTDSDKNAHWALSWSFVSFDPTNWSHAICLEPRKLSKSRFGRAA